MGGERERGGTTLEGAEEETRRWQWAAPQTQLWSEKVKSWSPADSLKPTGVRDLSYPPLKVIIQRWAGRWAEADPPRERDTVMMAPTETVLFTSSMATTTTTTTEKKGGKKTESDSVTYPTLWAHISIITARSAKTHTRTQKKCNHIGQVKAEHGGHGAASLTASGYLLFTRLRIM